MGNLSKADDMHDIGLSYHNYHEHNNSELRVLKVMLGNRSAWVWFARTHTTDEKMINSIWNIMGHTPHSTTHARIKQGNEYFPRGEYHSI